jgi:methyl-accepting chemotaxis protein WspA
MTRLGKLIDKILIRYSYTAKIRFILVVGYFAVFMLLIMNFIVLLRPLHNLENQKIGVEYLRKISLIFEKMGEALKYNKKQDNTLKESISKDLEGLIKNINGWAKSKAQDQFPENTINASTLVFARYWDQIKNSMSKDDEGALVEGLYASYQSLAEQISFFSGLTFNVDTGTAYLVNTISQDLPKIQHGIVHVLLSKMNMQNQDEFNFAKENLIQNNHQLFDEGNKAIQSLSSWLEEGTSDLLLDVVSFTNAVSKYVKMIEIPLESDSVEPMAVALSFSKNELLEASFKLNQKLQNLLLSALQSEKYALNSILWKCILILFFGGSLVLGLYLTRVIRHPLEKLVQAAQELSKGNVAIRIPITTKDEVALVTQAFNQMAEYFEKILRKAATVIDQIFVTSTTISSFTKEFESNMNTQERIVRQIASHAGSLQKGEEDFVEILQKANRVASITGSLAEMGHGNLHEMESIMNEMLAASSNVVATLSSLREKLVDIHQVIFAIVKIADQSNLLSLNTAIRATKSGSEGRGFVIIADKIKEMAEQIAFATLDIEKVVEDIVGAVQITVQEVDNFSGQILTQVKETTEIGSHLKHLIDATQGQVADFEKINDGMQSQTKGIIAINQVIEELRINVQESAFAVRKLYLEMEYLYDSSHTLHNTIKKFNFTHVDS